MNQAAINELKAQRNQAMDMLAQAAGVVEDLKRRIAELEEEKRGATSAAETAEAP